MKISKQSNFSSFTIDPLIKRIVGSRCRICECGAGSHVNSDPKFDLTLIEPNPHVFRLLEEKYPCATLHNVAIVDDNERTATVRLEGAQTHLIEIPDSPIFHKSKLSEKTIEVPAKTFDAIDTGFDVVILDMEGAEWYALKHMVSRPEILVIETHSSFTKYRNPFMIEIEGWMQANGYSLIIRGRSDSVWLNCDSKCS